MLFTLYIWLGWLIGQPMFTAIQISEGTVAGDKEAHASLILSSIVW